MAMDETNDELVSHWNPWTRCSGCIYTRDRGVAAVQVDNIRAKFAKFDDDGEPARAGLPNNTSGRHLSQRLRCAHCVCRLGEDRQQRARGAD